MEPADRRRALQRTLAWTGLAAAILVGIALRLAHFHDVGSRSPDERFYTEFARRLSAEGSAAMPEVFAEYERDPDRWSFPSPTRFGHLPLVAAAMELSGVRDERAGAAVSLLSSCLSLLLVAWMGVRFFGLGVALGAVAFLACSLGELGMARRAWQDSAFGLFGLLAIYATCEIARSPRRLALYPAFLAAGTLSLLTKQMGLISYGVCALWLLGYLAFRVRWNEGARALALAGIASIGVTVGIWGLLAGDVRVALSAVKHSFNPGDAGRGYVEACCTGPWYQFFYLIWIVGPLSAALAAVGTAVSLAPKRVLRRGFEPGAIPQPDCARAVASLTLAFLAFCAFVPGMQSLRYMSPANGTYALLAGIGLAYSLGLARRLLPGADYRLLVALAVVAVVVGGARDYRTFTTVVVETGMRDLAVVEIRSYLGR